MAYDSIGADFLRPVSPLPSSPQPLTRLIHDIFDLEKMEAGRVDYEVHELDAHELVCETIDDRSGMAKRMGVRFRTSVVHGAVVRGDRRHMVHALGNLADNALRVSPPGSEVEVSVAPRTLSSMRFSVRDCGAGLSSEETRDVFCPSNSSSPRGSRHSYTGLAATKEIVERHGGQIGFVNTPGEGTTFWIELAGFLATGSKKRWASTPLVLLLEDQDGDAAELVAAIKSEGPRLLRARTLEEAESYLVRAPPDIAFVKLDLPEGGGLLLVESMRRRPQSVPVVYLGSPRAGRAREESDPLIVGWLEKPYGGDEIRAAYRAAHALLAPTHDFAKRTPAAHRPRR